MFGISATEFLLLIVLAVIIFGPERMPMFARKAARVFVYLRDIANNAQTQLREELGPDFADLDITDLNPKTFVRKHMSAEIEAIEEAKRDLAGVQDSVSKAAELAKDEADKTNRSLKNKGDSAAAPQRLPAEEAPPHAPFDAEAT